MSETSPYVDKMQHSVMKNGQKATVSKLEVFLVNYMLWIAVKDVKI